ncbi:hypothetical protein PRK78_004918 [Emydomyces testavorans]|uniref:Asteroid domain-containing protein n=1 Tax=Emydomyces testavorans TaxID=2070801 RepID=A0AAF0IM54_9EURO|nr:hypothetical protein PRK78_004918 [Emydomyces testavorans]
MPPGLNAMTAQPTSNEVSIGVMKFLLQLVELSVTIEKIYFDGGLPTSKCDTRLERLETSRRKLEVFNNLSNQGLKSYGPRRTSLNITTHMVFNKQEPRIKLASLPENPFMIQSVIEDLKTRWNRDTIAEFVPSACDILPSSDYYIWKNTTEVVPGEADIYCADAAKQSGAAVLTGDSDLLVYDLGPHGSVIFFSSIESNEANAEHEPVRIRATELCPNEIAKRLGVRSIQRLAFELKRDPHLTLGKIVQRAKENTGGVENNASYVAFSSEYASLDEPTLLDKSLQILDPRVSELYLQYVHPKFNSGNQPPVIYLPILIENHSRQCAWYEGSEIRAVAFSILNLTVPPENRRDRVLEYARRGIRIFPTAVSLIAEDSLQARVSNVYNRLKSVLDSFGDASLLAWKSFAIQQIFSGRDEETWPSPGHITKFLTSGCCAEVMDWEDIHLTAQIQSIFYSLRILRQTLEVSISCIEPSLKDGVALLLQLLRGLPPMRDLSHSLSDALMSEPASKVLIKNAVAVIFSIRGHNTRARWPTCSTDSDETHSKVQLPGPFKKTNNIYDILGNID